MKVLPERDEMCTLKKEFGHLRKGEEYGCSGMQLRAGKLIEIRKKLLFASLRGTNFVGDERRLTELRNKNDEFCQPCGILWSFNTPNAPHQGGISEVKSMKQHLSRVLNGSHQMYEEM